MLDNYESLSGIEKAALLIMQLEDEAASKVLKSMEIGEITKVSVAMSNLGAVSSDVSQAILEEAYDYLNSEKGVVGNINSTKEILKKILGEEEAEEIIKDIDPDIWNKLSKLQPEKLSLYLHNESPQVIALVLQNYLPTLYPQSLHTFHKI